MTISSVQVPPHLCDLSLSATTLAQVLGNLAIGLGRQVPDGIELDIRNEELASQANITIFTASRLLNEWQRKGFLTKGRVKILLRPPEALLLNED